MSVKNPTFWILLGIKLLTSPQHTDKTGRFKIYLGKVQTSVVLTGTNSFF